MPPTLAQLPKNRHGKTDWQAVYKTVTTGQRLRLPDRVRGNAFTGARRGPFEITSQGNHDGTFDLIIGAPRKYKAPPVIASSGPFEGLTAADVVHKIKDAEQQLDYWTRHRVAQTDHRDRIASGARVQLWTMQLAALRHHLTTLHA